jgi:AraC-like DNA-binding protein
LLFKQVVIHEILHSDEVFALKARVLLKLLWLFTFLLLSILLSVQLAESGAIILPLLHFTRDANLEAEKVDRNYMTIQTQESGLCDAVLTSPMELLEKGSRLGYNLGRRYAEHLACALTMRILSFETRLDSRRNFPNVLSSSPRLRRIIEPMHAGLSSKIDLMTLAIESGYSRNHFLTMLWERTSHSPHQYFLRLRVIEAQKPMMNRSMPLMDIAFECGFASHSYLSDVFRQIVGATPSEFRRETLKHFPASVVVSRERALDVWTIAVCVNGLIDDHWRGKSVESDSLMDEELDQSPSRTALLLREVYRAHSGCWFAYISGKTTDSARVRGGFSSCALELSLLPFTENYRCSVRHQTISRSSRSRCFWHELVHAAISHAEARHQRLAHSYVYMTLAKLSGSLSVGRHSLSRRDIRMEEER